MRIHHRLYAARVFFGLCLVGLATFYVVTAREVFPAPFSDSPPHLIPILNYKTGHGFGAVYWELTRQYDRTGQHRFLQYPPLFHLVISGLIRHASAEALYVWLSGFSVAALGLCAALMWQGSRDTPGTRKPLWVLLASLGLCAVSTWLSVQPAAGRPEALTTPLILLAVLVLLRVRPSWRPAVAGMFIGLVAGTQIVNAILFGLGYAVHASLSGDAESRSVAARRWFRQTTVAAALGLLVFAGCLALGPHPAGETLRGIAYHAQHLASIRYAVWTNYFSPAAGGPFFGLFFIAALAGFWALERRHIHGLTGLNLGLLFLAVWYFAIRASDLTYNVFAFVPALAALAVRALARWDGEAATGSLRARQVAYGAAFAVFALMSVGLLRQGITFAAYKAYGVSFAEAKRRYTELMPPGEATPVYMAPSLWPLASRFDHLYLDQRALASEAGDLPETVKPWMTIHQWYNRLGTPPEMPGYQLVWSDFIERPLPRVLGLRLSATAPGYAFALYKPVEP